MARKTADLDAFLATPGLGCRLCRPRQIPRPVYATAPLVRGRSCPRWGIAGCGCEKPMATTWRPPIVRGHERHARRVARRPPGVLLERTGQFDQSASTYTDATRRSWRRSTPSDVAAGQPRPPPYASSMLAGCRLASPCRADNWRIDPPPGPVARALMDLAPASGLDLSSYLLNAFDQLIDVAAIGTRPASHRYGVEDRCVADGPFTAIRHCLLVLDRSRVRRLQLAHRKPCRAAGWRCADGTSPARLSRLDTMGQTPGGTNWTSSRSPLLGQSRVHDRAGGARRAERSRAS